jgi:hypothetical protein
MALPRELRPDSFRAPRPLVSDGRPTWLATSGFVLALLVPPVGLVVSALGWWSARRAVGFVAAVEIVLYCILF